MRIAAHRGARRHAPENSLPALISGYTGGADVLEINLQLTQDGHLVISHDGTTDRLTGDPGVIANMQLPDLMKLDFSKTYQPPNSPIFHYYTSTRRLAIQTFPRVLEQLPEDIELLIELKHDSSLTTGRREEFVNKVLDAIATYDLTSRVVLYSLDQKNLTMIRLSAPHVRIAAFDYTLLPDQQLHLMKTLKADGLVTRLEDVFAEGTLTAFGKALEEAITAGGLKVGAILYPGRESGTFTQAEWIRLKDYTFIWSLSTDSMLEVLFCRRQIALVDEPFSGTTLNRENFALGYAKANGFAEVTQNNGIHINIAPYPPFPSPPTDPLEVRLGNIETKLTYTAKDWPYYSGGGVGYVPGIRGDFAAEVDYQVETVAQATTLEMAVVNVDPGSHQAKKPVSFREKDSFYDPHGAPPYVGVEHDENDGMRINWNLGYEYDNNQYGKPVGDGATPRAGRLRLERRGEYFSAYYRNSVDALDWVCCGTTRNHSLNPVVFLRCVGKRWRQEDEANPSRFLPVIPNKFEFRNLSIMRFVK